jgi:hypothetical protein
VVSSIFTLLEIGILNKEVAEPRTVVSEGNDLRGHTDARTKTLAFLSSL